MHGNPRVSAATRTQRHAVLDLIKPSQRLHVFGPQPLIRQQAPYVGVRKPQSVVQVWARMNTVSDMVRSETGKYSPPYNNTNHVHIHNL